MVKAEVWLWLHMTMYHQLAMIQRKIFIILLLQRGSSLDHLTDASSFNSVRYLGFPVVSTTLKVFFNPYPSILKGVVIPSLYHLDLYKETGGPIMIILVSCEILKDLSSDSTVGQHLYQQCVLKDNPWVGIW
jgi:hypothetical protein